eukprot:TRINITY_DN352_c1_g1_i17.p1 TRINITY_DN352_c1_g1~~TRINITY_DN352_c1_g1_i17.p1  ORF type:complete len:229 (-),score=65.27 TRINITY_DN352_c1_g1_i17:416-1102(-)
MVCSGGSLSCSLSLSLSLSLLPLSPILFPRRPSLVTSLLVKLNANPYVLYLDLVAPIDPDSSSAVIADTQVVFTLEKAEVGIWGALTIDTSKMDKKELFARREQSNEEARLDAQRKAKELEQKREADAKFAREQQWELERKERERLQREKEEQRREAERELEEWRKKSEKEEADAKRKAKVPEAALGTEGPDSDDEDDGVNEGRSSLLSLSLSLCAYSGGDLPDRPSL